MKPKTIAIAVTVFIAMVLAAIFWFNLRHEATHPLLPKPNGFAEFAEAAQTLAVWNGDLTALPPEGIRAVLSQNAKALELIRRGLKKECAMPVTNDMNWFVGQMSQTMANKRMAQLLIAEGSVQRTDGHINEAARSFADCIVFAHAAHHRGLIIHELVAIAGQEMGSRRLVPVAPQLSPETLREILRDLLALDHERETAGTILRRDREWSRGASGMWRVMWQNVVMRSQTRAAESSFAQKETRSVAALRLIIAELAVRGYQATNGKPPATLAELVPAWLPAVPIDPYSHQPLLYRVSTNSFFRLYSVGPDGKDDQGTPLKRGNIERGDLLP